MKLHHGGRLRAAAEHYGIALSEWLDFSTAINPQAWPVPAVPPEVWQRLPEDNDGLMEACHVYYGRQPCLPVPGTQAVIEALPRFYLPRRVWVPAIGYQEHAHCWQKQGHRLQRYARLPEVDQLQPQDVLVVINPNNPTSEIHSPQALHALASHLNKQQGLLVVDEAFMDSTPNNSLLNSTLPPATLVLRSFGKFFGLAGIRLGFCFAPLPLLQRLDETLGPWAVNHPARWIAQHAFGDVEWQQHARATLQRASQHLSLSLQQHMHNRLPTPVPIHSTALFVTLTLGCSAAGSLYTWLARNGILVRWYAEEGLLRIGVDANPAGIQRLLGAVSQWQPAP